MKEFDIFPKGMVQKLVLMIKSKLALVAFTGKYSDLSGKPSIPDEVRVKGNNETAYRTGNVNLTAANIGAFPGTTTIPNGSDLNNYTTPGIYSHVASNDITNNPVSTSSSFCLMVVQTGAHIRQIWIGANPETGKQFTRYKNSSSNWGAWVEIKITDTTYNVATQSVAGLESAADKKKLDGIPADTQAQITDLGTDLDNLDYDTVKKRRSAGTFTTVADLWKVVEELDDSGVGCLIRFKIGSASLRPPGTTLTWVRTWCTYQNRVGNGAYDIAGSILLTAGGAYYIGKVSRGINGYDDLTVVWQRIYEMTGATSDANGLGGMVPTPPSSGYNTKYLRADGAWAVPPDVNVTQNDSSADGNYRLLLSRNANDTNETATVRKSNNFYANPSNGAFYAKGYDRVVISGQKLDLNTLTLESGQPHIMRYIVTSSGGSASITNRPVTTEQSFILDVELIRYVSKTDYITVQTYRNSGVIGSEYIRTCNSGAWGLWTKRTFAVSNV